MAVQKVVRIVAAVAAIGLVGYAVVVASRPEPEAPAAAKDGGPRPRAGASKSEREPSSASAERRARVAATKSAAGPLAATPAPEPTTPVDYEKAYGELETFVTELETMNAKSQTIPQPEWVERYRRGNELVDALMRTSQAKDEEERKDVLALNMRFREVIQKVLAKP